MCVDQNFTRNLSQNMVNERQGSYKRNMVALVQLRR